MSSPSNSKPKTKKQLVQELELLQRRIAELETQLQSDQDKQKFKALFEQSLDAMLITDDHGHYLEVNPAACQLLGISRENFLTMQVVDIMPAGKKKATEQNWQVFVKDGEQSGEFEFHRSDGVVLQLEYKAKAAFLPGLHLSILRDITPRKKVEENLRESQKLYRTLAQNIPNGDVFLFDRELRCLLAEGTLMRTIGYNPELLEGKLLQETVRPEIYHLLEPAYQQTLAGHSSQVEYLAQNRYFSVHFMPVRDEAGQIFAALALSQELTERKRLEEELRTLNEALEARVVERTAQLQAALLEKEEAEQFSQAIANALPDVLYIIDLGQQQNLYVNRDIAVSLGYTPAQIEVMGPNPFQTIMHPQDLAELPNHLERLTTLKDGEIVEREYRGKAASGEWHWFYSRDQVLSRSETGQPKLILGLSEDITLRKQTEAQLREKEEQYRSIFEATSEAMFIVEPQTDRIVEVNPAACGMYGYSREEFLKLGATAQLVHPNYHYFLEKIPPLINSGQGFRAESINLRKDGSQFYVDGYTTSFTYQGRPHALAVIRDVTEQKEAYQLLERRVEERTRELSTLLEVIKSLNTTLDLNSLLELVLTQLGKLIPFTSASIATLDQAGQLELVVYRGPDTLEQAKVRHKAALKIEAIAASVQNVMSEGEVLIIEDAFEGTNLEKYFENKVYPLGPFFENIGYSRSLMVIPLIVKDESIGLMTLVHNQPGYYTERHAKLAKAVANQAAIALENAELYQQAKQLAIVEERQRIARDLHDSVNQVLYGISLSVNTALSLLELQPQPDERLVKNLEEVLTLTEAGLDEMRSLIFELRPESLATEGLLAALTRQIMSLKSRYHLEADLHLPSEEPALPLEIKEALYRVAQEALHNIVKHARANQVALRLTLENEQTLVLEIRDNGQGFNPDQEFPGHLGLHSMRERTHQIGGQFRLESRPGKGTYLQVKLPLPFSEGSL
jgi:PAS domain S-box-containing protein